MTGTIQGPICFHIALEWLSLCDSGLWGWVVGILCSACWNKVDCWILFHNWIDFVHRSKSGSQLKSSTISKTVSTYDFWQTLTLHLIQILFATFYSFSTFWSGVHHWLVFGAMYIVASPASPVFYFTAKLTNLRKLLVTNNSKRDIGRYLGIVRFWKNPFWWKRITG